MTFPGEGLRQAHEVVIEGLAPGADVLLDVRATDRNGNTTVRETSFRTLPPFLHVHDLTIEKSGGGPFTVKARVLVTDHRHRPVSHVPLRGLWSGDLGGNGWHSEAITDETGWATLRLVDFWPSAPTTIGFSPAYLGSADPAHPYFVGRGGQQPAFFYDQSANEAHFRTIEVP
jgi:hypothetical protein